MLPEIKGNQKWTIKINWQQMVHKMKKNKTKTQHNMCWTPLCINKHKSRKYNISPPKTTGGNYKEEPNIFF